MKWNFVFLMEASPNGQGLSNNSVFIDTVDFKPKGCGYVIEMPSMS